MNPVHIDLAYRPGDQSWHAAILDDHGNALWRSAEPFHTADVAYYRAVGQFVLSMQGDNSVERDISALDAQVAKPRERHP